MTTIFKCLYKKKKLPGEIGTLVRRKCKMVQRYGKQNGGS